MCIFFFNLVKVLTFAWFLQSFTICHPINKWWIELSPCPTFFLYFNNLFHTVIYHNAEEKIWRYMCLLHCTKVSLIFDEITFLYSIFYIYIFYFSCHYFRHGWMATSHEKFTGMPYNTCRSQIKLKNLIIIKHTHIPIPNLSKCESLKGWLHVSVWAHLSDSDMSRVAC